jgi:hypothetical protein
MSRDELTAPLPAARVTRPGPPRIPRADGPTPTPTSAPTPTPTSTPTRVEVGLITALALLGWVGFVAVGRTWGLYLMQRGDHIVLYTPPLLGGYQPSLPPHLWWAAAVGVAGVLVLPRTSTQLRWWPAVVTSVGVAAAWWAALALGDGSEGASGLTRGLFWGPDHDTAIVPAADDPLRYLRTFLDRLPGGTIQTRAHPPGFQLTVAPLERLGLGGEIPVTAFILLVALSGLVAVAITVRAVAGETLARRALPFLALAPAAIWVVTSTDALFAGVAAWFVAAFVASTRSAGRRADGLAVVAGLLAAYLAMLSYGLVLMGPIVVAVALYRRAWRPLLIATAVAIAGVVAFVPLGFWWGAGLMATKHEYDTLGVTRPYSYFLVNNIAAWALALGPATAVALARLRDRRLWLLVGGGVAAAAIANFSGMSEGEVERIWLPFTVWVLAAGAVFGPRIAAVRVWLGLQVVCALVVTATIGTLW